MDLHGLLSIAGFAVFGLVWAGLLTNILRIAGRQSNPPSFSLFLNGTHLGRFAGWALVGAAAFQVDPWTGALLMTTRIPGSLLVVVTFVQRKVLRPPPALLARTVVPVGLALLALCAALVTLPPGEKITLSFAGTPLPPATPVAYALNGFVLLCFAVQVFIALPRQIHGAWHKPLGNLRWFQLGLLANYAFSLLYAGFVRDGLVQLAMRLAYGLVFVEQLALVFLIERGIRAYRRAQVEGRPG
jgi:hypothetical protein